MTILSGNESESESLIGTTLLSRVNNAVLSPERNHSFGYGDVMEICKTIASSIARQDNNGGHVGMLIQFRDMLQGKRDVGVGLEESSFEDTFRTYISSFTRHVSRDTLPFSQSQDERGYIQEINNGDAPLTPQGRVRVNGGRIREKRLMTMREQCLRGTKKMKSLTSSKPRAIKCSFCLLVGHKKGSAKCAAFTTLEACFVNSKDAKDKWSMRLGCQKLHKVELPSLALRRSFGDMDWATRSTIPNEVLHLVLLRCYYSPAHAEYQAKKVSVYKKTKSHEMVNIPSMEDNVVELLLLKEGALHYMGDGAFSRSPCFLLVSTVRQWIVSNCKKSTSRYLLTCLPGASTSEQTENTY